MGEESHSVGIPASQRRQGPYTFLGCDTGNDRGFLVVMHKTLDFAVLDGGNHLIAAADFRIVHVAVVTTAVHIDECVGKDDIVELNPLVHWVHVANGKAVLPVVLAADVVRIDLAHATGDYLIDGTLEKMDFP